MKRALCRRIPTLAAALLLALAPLRAPAVIVALGDGTQNTSAPADDFGFANLAPFGFGTAVYLSDGWVLSAYHLVADGPRTGFAFPQSTLFGSEIDPASVIRLSNSDHTFADLVVFHLRTSPLLSSVTLAAAPLAAGDNVSMAGDGYDRQANETHWTADWQVTTGPGEHQGYIWAGTHSLRWGVNQISAASTLVDDTYGVTSMFTTTFDRATNEAQGAIGDSGGGVFTKISGGWQLAGTILTTDDLNQQPGLTSAFGDTTGSADLSVYRAQIQSIIPEPAPGLLAALTLAFGACGRRTARAARPSRRRG